MEIWKFVPQVEMTFIIGRLAKIAYCSPTVSWLSLQLLVRFETYKVRCDGHDVAVNLHTVLSILTMLLPKPEGDEYGGSFVSASSLLL